MKIITSVRYNLRLKKVTKVWWKMKLFHKMKQIFLKIGDWFLIEPKRLVRLAVLSICSIVVFFQLWECVMKLLHPPISTHSHFDLNQSMFYPAVTFCREPGYKPDVMSVSLHLISIGRNHSFRFNRNTICRIIHRWLQAGQIFLSKRCRSQICLKKRLTQKTKCLVFSLWMEITATLSLNRAYIFRWDDVTRWFQKYQQFCR